MVRVHRQNGQLTRTILASKPRPESQRGEPRARTVGGNQNSHHGTLPAVTGSRRILEVPNSSIVLVPSLDSTWSAFSVPSSESSTQTCLGSSISCSTLEVGGAAPR